MAEITVFRFKKFDVNEGQNVVSKLYATKAAINQIKAEILLEESMEIDEALLDGNGMYDPRKSVKS